MSDRNLIQQLVRVDSASELPQQAPSASSNPMPGLALRPPK